MLSISYLSFIKLVLLRFIFKSVCLSIQQVEKVGESLNTTKIGPHIVPSKNESGIHSMTAITKRRPSHLHNIEAGLGKARAVIKEARINGNQSEDPDYVPGGPMYWNANAFHRYLFCRSYNFRIFMSFPKLWNGSMQIEIVMESLRSLLCCFITMENCCRKKKVFCFNLPMETRFKIGMA